MSPPRESYPRIFLRFLRFGLLAWGGPVAQIAMVREELVEQERWISQKRFNRVLSVYQALPGPEAHELCVYFGYVARGRLGGLLAGLGFMLPGFALMLVLAWAYVRYGLVAIAPEGLFYGFQAAVLALIVRGIFLIGRHAVVNLWLFAIALGAAVSELAGIHFAITLVAAGAAYAAVRRGLPLVAVASGFAVGLIGLFIPALREVGDAVGRTGVTGGGDPSTLRLFGSGLLAGLLTFGGAYSVIPFLRRESVVAGAWVTNSQFVDGLALTGILPAPLVIFGTFVGYLGGGFAGALAVTAGIFLPAFSFTLVGYRYLERIVDYPPVHAFLDGVTAGVVGLIAATVVRLAPTTIPDIPGGVLAALALAVLMVWRSKAAIAGVVLASGVLGILAVRL